MKKMLHLMMCFLKNGMRIRVSLSALTAFLVIFSLAKEASAQSYPFPQNVDYSFGLAKPTGVSQQHVVAAYNHWVDNYVTASQACGFRRVIFDYYPGTTRGKADRSRTVSEGIAYGMLISAYMGDRSLFDDLWGYYKRHRNENGVMHWMIENCQVVGRNGASDAELDVAMALIVASHQWQSDSYVNDAKMMIRIIREKQFEGDVLKPGDMFGGNNLVCPSYFSPAYYKVFKDYDPGQGAFWDAAIAKSYQIINAAGGTSGLVPDWCTAAGQVSSLAAQNGYEDQGKNFIFDAIRTPFRAGIDYLWHGTPAAKTYCEKISTWLMNNHSSPGQIGSKYGTRLNNNEGARLSSYSNNTFLGCFAVGLMGTDLGTNAQNYLNQIYQTNLNLNPGYGEYFNASFKMLSLLVLTGNFYLPPPDQCEGPELGDNRSLCEGSITLNAGVANRTYVWRRNGTVINGQTARTLAVTQPGNYEVIATDPSGCVRRDKVEILPAEVKADFVAQKGPGNITLINTSTGGISDYSWVINGGIHTSHQFGTDRDALIDQLAAGPYEITLTVNNSGFGCSQTSNVTKTVIIGDGVGVAMDDFNYLYEKGIVVWDLAGAADAPFFDPIPKKECSREVYDAGGVKDCFNLPCSYLKVVAHGTDDPYKPFGIGFEREAGPMDLTDVPYVSLKIKTSADIELGVKLQTGTIASDPLFVTLAAGVEEVVNLDFTTMTTGWDNAASKAATITAYNAVNAIQFVPFQKDADWAGTIEIDWIVIGAKSLAPPSFNIETDELGFTKYGADGEPLSSWSGEFNACDGNAVVEAKACTADEVRWFSGNTLLGTGSTIELTPGTYMVHLVNQGGVTVDTFTVKGANLKAEFTHAVESNGRGIRLFNNSTDFDSWEWDYGTVPGNAHAPTWDVGFNYYEEDGIYNVCLTVQNATCSTTDRICKEIEVKCEAPLSPISNFTYNGTPVENDTISLCSGNEALIRIDAVDNAADKGYGWYGVGLASLSDTNFVERIFSASHWLKVEAYNICGEKVDDSVYVNVLPAATADFTFERISETAMKYAFEAEWVGDEDKVTYSWTWGSVVIGTGIYIEYEFETDGVKEVTLTVINECGSDEATKQVGCTYPVVANATITGLNSICGAVNCQSYSVAGITGADDITWSAATGGTLCQQSGNTASFSFTQSSTIRVVASNACGDAAPVTLDVEIKQKPATSAISGEAAPACASAGNVYSVTGSAGSSYQWTVPSGAQIVSGNNTNSITVDFGTTNGAITVVETSADGCVGDAKELAVMLEGCALSANFSVSSATVCTDAAVTFTDLSTGVTPNTVYAWSFGTGASPATVTTKGPHQVTYTTTGPKTVKLVITLGTLQEEHTMEINVGAKPVSPASMTGPEVLCPGESGTYSITTVANATKYNWTYPVGATVSQNNNQLTVTLGNSGGAISVTPENTCGTGTAVSKTVTRGTQPSTSAINGLASGYCKDKITYSVTGGQGSTYQWTIPQAHTLISGNGTNTVVIELGSVVGESTISVVETTSTGCVGTAVPKVVTVDGCGLTANFTPSTATPCVGTAMTFTGTSSASPNATYSWNFGEGATPATSFQSHKDAPISVTYSTAGTKTVTLTVSDNGESDVKTFPLNVGVKPEITGQISGPSTVCKDVTAQFSITAVQGVSVYQWSATGGAAVTGTSSTVSIKFASGSSVVRVSASNSCGTSAPVQKEVTVFDEGVASVSIDVPKTTIKEGERLTFAAISQNGGDAASYSWYVNDLFVGSGTEYSSTSLQNGDEVYVTMLSSVSCVLVKEVTSAPVTITVEEIQPGEAFAGADMETCDEFVRLDANVPTCNSGAATGTWTLVEGSGNFAMPNVAKSLVSGLAPGRNVFRWTVSCGGTSNYDDVVVTLKMPTVSITADKTEICEGTSVTFRATVSDAGTNDTYQWTLNSNNVGTNPTFTSATLANNDNVRLTYGSSVCATTKTLQSNVIRMTVSAQPTTSVAGSAISTDVPQASLKANTPSVGQGTWTVVSGSGTFVNPNSPNTVVRNLTTGRNEFQWTITNGVCNASESRVSVTYGTTPVIDGGITGPPSVTEGETATYSVPNIPGAEFVWSVPAGATIVSGQGTNTITVRFGNGVSGPVSVHAENDFGAGPAVSLPVVSVPGVVKPVIIGPSRVQTGKMVEFSIQNPEQFQTISWSLPAGIQKIDEDKVSGTIIVQILSTFESGTLVVSVTSMSGKSESAPKELVAGSKPVKETIDGPTIVEPFKEYTYKVPFYEGSTWEWSLPAGAVIVADNGNEITVRFGENVDGIVSVIERNNGNSAESNLQVNGVVGYGNALAVSFEVYPNPFANQATIFVNTPSTMPVSVSVVNEQGLVVKESANYYTNQAIMLGADLNTGVYFVKVTMENRTEVFKLVKIK